MSSALDRFDARVAAWFRRRYGAPTGVQELAWPRIAAGEHVLAVAPTGSGKTLAGFLWALDRLLTGAWEGGAVRVLYVSPLKALNADIERNLRSPLAELRRELASSGFDPPAVHVAVRSGDTPAAERARMLRRAPEILITTPESLNLLLLSARAESLLAGVRTVILDEIHAVVSNKRGTHLITAVDRLVRLAGEFQRVAMSATVRPVERVARFVGGWRSVRGAGGEVRHEPRPVAVLAARSDKRYDLSVRFPFPPAGESDEQREGDAFWRRLAEDLHARIRESRSTIVFTNSRRLAEKATRFVNEAAGREIAWSHHGSLSRELRRAVEERLKAGSLPAIVATSSLELGIDVGALDRVLLLQSPRTLSSAAQRVGRAGHGVGEVSRAVFYPTHARDFLDCAVAVAAVRAGEIEPVRPVRSPLDLLAQTVLACVARERWALDELYGFLRGSDPFHELAREQFDLVVEMLAGRYAQARVEELRPRVAIDRIAGTIEGRPGLARLLARAGGTIPDRGYFQLRVEGSKAKLGELDEEFVWERSVGDGFVLGAQAWRVSSIGANEVLVTPARGGALLAPFWRADARDREAFFSERVADLLERAEARLGHPDFADELAAEHGFEPAAAAELVRLLREQRAALGVPLPHRRHLVIEDASAHGEGAERRQVILYTFWGGSVNRPLALALTALWQEREGTPLETVVNDDAVLFVLPPGVEVRDLLLALEPERCEELLRARLESTGFFGAHFRQNAQRALLLPRAGPSRRTPLWVSRQNAKRLLESVARHDDFPLVLETWRTCLADEFELDVLRERLRELAAGEVRLSSVRTARPSPFATGLVRARTNELMYEDDTPEARRASALRGDLLREIALQASGRPAIPSALAGRFTAKAQRLQPGYAPRDAGELLEWVKERLILPFDEWRALLDAIDRDRVESAGEPAAAEMVAAIAPKLVRWRPSPDLEAVSALECAFRLPAGTGIARAFAASARALQEGGALEADPGELGARAPGAETGVTALATIVSQVLPFYGSLSPRRLGELTGASEAEVEGAVGELVRAERAVAGELIDGDGERRVAARSVFETLLRWKRAAARPDFRALPLEHLPAWVARQQGLIERAHDVEGLQRALEKLFGATLPAGLWEREVLTARLGPYQPAWLDTLFDDSELVWTGSGIERATFVFRHDLDLLTPDEGGGAGDGPPGDALEHRLLQALRAAPRGLDLTGLAEATGAGTAVVTTTLWSLAWRGRVACDSMRALRQGVLAGFQPVAASGAPDSGRPSRRGAFRRWQGSRPFPGRWFAAERAAPDPIAAEERNRERARLLLERWGVLFRELTANELPALSWGRLARSLRALELAGEVVAGRFFEGIPGLQFAAPSALARLREGEAGDALWWQSAADPSSLAGLDLAELKAALPRRLPTTHVVWRGARVAAVLRRSGRELEFRVPADDPELGSLVEPLRVALTRAFDPERSLEVESINGAAADGSAWRGALDAFAVTREGGGVLRLRRRWS